MDVIAREPECQQIHHKRRPTTQVVPQTREEFNETTPVPSIESIEDLVRELYKVFESDRVNIDYVQKLMSSYNCKPKELKKYAKFDPHSYTRNLIDEGNGKFNLMLLCWSEGQGSSIHAHSDSHCFMKCVQAELKETRFAWPDEDAEETEMTQIGEAILRRNEVCYINDDLGLHRVENPSNVNPAMGIHLYSPPFDQCDTFDQRTGHKRHVKVTFYSKFGDRTPYRPKHLIEPENN